MKTQQDVTLEYLAKHLNYYAEEDAKAGTLYGERLHRAARLLEAGAVKRLAPADYEVSSGTTKGTTYHVNGECTCPDARKAHLGWCKHRIAVRFYRLVEADLKKLTDKGIPNHTHTWNCEAHRDLDLPCWQHPCPDRTLLECPTCTTPLTAEEIHVFGAEPEENIGPNPNVPAYVEAIISEEGVPTQEYIVAPDVPELPPLELQTAQYEEAPAPDEIVPFLPEAAVSCCLTFKTPGGGQITYTMRAHTDAEVLARIPAVLAGLEQQLDTGSQKHGWFTRVYNSLLSPAAREDRESQEYVPRSEYQSRTRNGFSGK